MLLSRVLSVLDKGALALESFLFSLSFSVPVGAAPATLSSEFGASAQDVNVTVGGRGLATTVPVRVTGLAIFTTGVPDFRAIARSLAKSNEWFRFKGKVGDEQL